LGEKHLREIGFGEKDLLIASSEGGETPYVIGATKAAAKISQQKAFFLYCNPTQDLADRSPRSKQIIENKNVNPIELFVGSMALSGSTRMQASTVLQLAIGWCLLEEGRGIPDLYQEFMAEFSKLDYQKLAPFIEKEHFIYTENEFVMYMPRQLALTVFTDSTERSPTFSLPAFENENFQKGATPSLSYILIPAASDKEEAWFNLIGRTPKALDWASDPRTGKDYLGSFDFSRQAVENREERLDYKRQYLFEIFYKKQTLHWSLAGLEEDWPISTESSIGVNTLLKLLLNTHSTLLMGKLGRYESNVMTWVKPTNGKLVDRAARYVQYLLKEEGKNSDYLEIVHLIYKHKNEALNQAPVVQRVLEEIRKK
jgi:N-acetylmuramic acid 6-phosphate etherase